MKTRIVALVVFFIIAGISPLMADNGHQLWLKNESGIMVTT